ncbi:hypothetical protein ACF08O_37360 [Streptomyces paradoxus]|uniref:hypothetical protein n=1 Tax=Streptomyces paradoxus TaxID=66375 RepID=UPI0036FFA515
MHHSARTAPVAGGARPRFRVAALPAVALLALLAALGIAAPSPGTPVPGAAAATAAAVHHRYDETRADDGCDAACAARAVARHEQHSEQHPGPRGHFGTGGRSADVTPCRVTGLPQAASGNMPSSQPPSDREQVRAPPVSSGT